MPIVKLQCSCGKVKGETKNISSDTGTRIVCCCDDCQSFARYLKQETAVLDEYGGTDIFQMPISHLKVITGKDQIGCVKLSPKGMFRWYAMCCNTPIGNTLGPGMPFIGVIHNIMDNAAHRDTDLGTIRGYVQTKFAKKELPSSLNKSTFGVLLRTISKLLVWKLKGLSKPSDFFDAKGEPIAQPKILN